MSQIAAQIVTRYGYTTDAEALFYREAERCQPPLPDYELESIWKGKEV